MSTPRWIQFASACLVGLASSAAALGDDWPQWLGPKRDGVWRETGIFKSLPKGGIKPEWTVPVGEGYAGPAVGEGKVVVTDWIKSPKAPKPASAFAKVQMQGTERVLCIDQASGKVEWTFTYDCPYQVSYSAGPRCTPVIQNGRVYTLGTMGNLYCLDLKTKKVIWSKSFVKDYEAKVPVWGFSCHPVIDGDKLICMVGGNQPDSMVVAFHKDTGKELWRSLTTLDTDHGPGYCPPTIIEYGKTRQLIVWHPKAVTSLDVETGKTYWHEAFELKAGLSIPTPRLLGDRLFVTAFYNGPLMMQLSQDKPVARVLWRGRSNSERKTDGLHSIMSTPYLKDGHIYGVCSYGQLRCLRIDSGERIWESLQATGGKEERWGNAFIIAHEDQFFLFNEHGELMTARLSPDGYKETSRIKIIEPTNNLPGRPVVWMHPAFANKRIYARNDKELVAVSLEATSK